MDRQTLTQLQAQRNYYQEIEKRVAAHQQNVERIRAARTTARDLAVAVDNKPLFFLTQGDSWFDYPLRGNGPLPGDTDVIANLRRIGPMPPVILNLAVAGDTAVNLMSLRRQNTFIEQLQNEKNWPDGKPDAILFSAGGNDVAGEEFCIFLDFNDGVSRGLNTERFSRALGMVEACYLSLFALRDRLAPEVPVFGHCYDYPTPNGIHPFCAGPWLKPSLDYCNWPVSSGTAIVREAMIEFRAMLMKLEADKKNNFHLIQTQGVLMEHEWANELHPDEEGFKKIANVISQRLDSYFGNRMII